MTANGQARFSEARPEHPMTREETELADEINREFSSSLLEPPETTSRNASKWTYRGRFMEGRELEYEATLEAYREIYREESNNHIQALTGCRTYASLRREKTSGNVKVFGDSCRDRWCPMCAGQKASYAKEQSEEYVRSLKAPRFLTLTLRNNENDLKTQVSFLQKSFSTLRQRAFWKKHVTGGIWFLQVKRGKGSGCWHPHLHILLDGDYLEQRRLSALWEQVTFNSPVIDIRRIHDAESAASYVARYTARPAALADMPLADRVEVIEALFRKRLCGTFGTAKAVTLTPPKIAADGEWKYIGNFDQIVEQAEHCEKAKRILYAFNNDLPLSAQHFEDFTGFPPDRVHTAPVAEPPNKQMYLDFYH